MRKGFGLDYKLEVWVFCLAFNAIARTLRSCNHHYIYAPVHDSLVSIVQYLYEHLASAWEGAMAPSEDGLPPAPGPTAFQVYSGIHQIQDDDRIGSQFRWMSSEYASRSACVEAQACV